ncbi:MAG: RNA 2',3'-cyclic phosphodiesterase [Spirochaetota bacterium]
MRLFYGIELDNEIKNKISEFISDLSYEQEGKVIKWVKKDNLHITLQFIGDTNEDIVPELKKLASDISFKSFDVSITKIGAFPYMKKPRVIWAGTEQNMPLFRELHHKIRNICLKVAEDDKSLNIDTKPFHPHITIGRVKKRPNPEFIERLQKNKNIEFGIQKIRNFTLFSSELHREGPIYKIVDKIEAQ